MMFLLFIRFAFFALIGILLAAFLISWYNGKLIGEWIDETVEEFTKQPEKDFKKEEV